MMVKVHIQSPRLSDGTLAESERVYPFGYTLDFEATSVEEALAAVDQVRDWAMPTVQT